MTQAMQAFSDLHLADAATAMRQIFEDSACMTHALLQDRLGLHRVDAAFAAWHTWDERAWMTQALLQDQRRHSSFTRPGLHLKVCGWYTCTATGLRALR